MIGILGGMGPAATADFFSKLIQLTPATRDQEHLPVVIANLPHTPDRSSFLVGNGPDPLPRLLDGIALLNRMQVGLIVVSCNTAHHWFETLASHSAAPMLHIATACGLSLTSQNITRVAFFATRGALKSGFYQREMTSQGIEGIVPSENIQVWVDACIRSVKAGDIQAGADALRQAIALMQPQGVEAIIMACTEIPLAAAKLQDDALSAFAGVPLLIDSTLELARQAVLYGIRHHWNRPA